MSQHQLIERYIDKAGTEKGKKAGERVFYALKKWKLFIGNDDVTPAKLDEFTTWLYSKGLKKSTCKWEMSNVKALLRWQVRLGECDLNDSDIQYWPMPKCPRPQPVVWKPGTINTLLKTAAGSTHRSAQRWRVFLLLGLGLGARPGELFRIKADDVDIDRTEVTIWGTKTGVQRRVPYFESTSLMKLMPHLWKFMQPSFHTLCDLALIERQSRKHLRSTADAYIASGSKMPEYLIASRFGHTTKVAMESYREPIYNVEGKTIEEWMKATEGFERCTEAAMAYKYKNRTARHP